MTVEFETDDPQAAEALRETIATLAEHFRGIDAPVISGGLPEHMAWVNTTGEPGDGRLLDLRTVR